MRDTKLRIALVQQHAGPDVKENIERGARAKAEPVPDPITDGE